MKWRYEGSALAAGGNIRLAKIADSRNSIATGYDFGVANLQRVGFPSARLVAQGLAVTANSNYVGRIDAGGFDDSPGCITKTFTHAEIEIAGWIQWHIKWFADGGKQSRFQFRRILQGMRRMYRNSPITETDKGGIDAVHAGAGHQADVISGHVESTGCCTREMQSAYS